MAKLSEAFGGVRVDAFGVSNGGAFVLELAEYCELGAACSQIMAPPAAEMKRLKELPDFPARVCFDHMPRDDATAARVAEAGNVFAPRGNRPLASPSRNYPRRAARRRRDPPRRPCIVERHRDAW